MVGVWQHTIETGLKTEDSVPLSWDRRSTSWQLTPGGYGTQRQKNGRGLLSWLYMCDIFFSIKQYHLYAYMNMYVFICIVCYTYINNYLNILICSPRFSPSTDLPGNLKSQTEIVPDLIYWTLGWLIHFSEPLFLLRGQSSQKHPLLRGPMGGE